MEGLVFFSLLLYFARHSLLTFPFFQPNRLCHFGSGKLIFESSKSEQLMRCIEIFHTKNRTDSPKLRSSTINHHHRHHTSSNSSTSHHVSIGGKSSQSSNNTSIGSCSIAERSPLSLSCDADDTVFDTRSISLSSSPPSGPFHHPTSEEDRTSSEMNTHAKLKRTEFKDSHKLIHTSNSSSSSSTCSANCPNDDETEHNNISTDPSNKTNEHFAEITSEDGYVLPNEPEGIDSTDHQDVINTTSSSHMLLSRDDRRRSSPNSSDNENEMSSSYLQIVDNEDSSQTSQECEDVEAKRILDEITTKLTDPQNAPDSSVIFSPSHPSHPTHPTILNSVSSPQLKRDSTRRSSEPPKPLSSQRAFEKDQQKLTSSSKSGGKKVKESYSMDLSSTPLTLPQATPVSVSNCFKKTNAFPKQHSISHGNHDSVSGKADKTVFSNPFDNLGSFFLSHTTSPRGLSVSSQPFSKFPSVNNNVSKTTVNRLRRNYTESVLSTPIKCPELDRNTKPKALRSKNLDGLNRQSAELTINTSSAIEQPPVIPERVSPKPYTASDEQLKKKLQRSSYLNYTDGGGETDESCEQNHTTNALKSSAPPLPPKCKLLSSTRSAPIPTCRRSSAKESNNNSLLRSSSLGITICTQQHNERKESFQTSCESSSIEVIAETNTSTKTTTPSPEEVPPEVPLRQPTHPLVRKLIYFDYRLSALSMLEK